MFRQLEAVMRLSRLEISGFKSFGTRVQLDFPSDLCAIVGPNGSGKSNVVDALRWVMGEQSAKSLRGRTMEDVIFAGSQNRPPAGLAEVTLVFSRDERQPPPLPSLNFPEIRITRILHRDGTSEYKLMNQPCRLKDIVDVFAGTGLGSRSYAIIEQGKIASVIAARPEERRQLFEDAAQISRYRMRRRESEKRLEESRHHLERIGDIVRELENRLHRLERQKEVALRHDELERQLRHLDRWRFVHQGRELSLRIRTARAELDALETRFGQLQTELMTARTEAQDVQLQKTEAESAYRLTVDALIDLEKRLAQARTGLQVSQSQKEQAARTIEGFQGRRGQTRQKLEGVQDLVRQSEEKRRHLESVVSVKREELELLEQQLRTARNVRQDMEGALSRQRAELLQLEKTVSAQAALAENAVRKRESLVARQKSLEADWRDVQAKIEENEKSMANGSQKLQEAKNRLAQAQAELRQQEDALAPLEAQGRELEAEILKVRQNISSLQGKFDYLDDFLRHHMDADEKTRQFWELLQEKGLASRLAGPLFEAFEPDPGFVDALEIALAGQLQSPRIQNPEDALELATLAAAACRGVELALPRIPLESGRDFAPSESGSESSGNPDSKPGIPDAWIPLVEHVRVLDARFAYRIEGWYRVPSLADALAHADRIPPGGGCIAPDGTALHAGGVLRIHESGPQTSLRVRAERDRLAQELEQARTRMNQLEQESESVANRRMDLQERLRRQREAENAVRKDVQSLEMEENRLRAQAAALRQVEQERRRTLDSIVRELESAAVVETDADLMDSLHQKQEELKRELDRYRETAARVDSLSEQMQSARVAVESWSQKVESEKRLQARLEEEAAAMQATLEEIAAGIESAIAHKTQLEQDAAAHESAIAILDERLVEQRQIHDEVRTRMEELARRWESVNERIRRLERQLAPLSGKRNDLQSEIARMEGNLGYLEKDFSERFPMERLDWLVEGEEFPEAFGDVQRRQREEMLQELETLRSDYNPNAIHEYDEVQERLTGLQLQLTDLSKAVNDLDKAIAHITELSRQRLLETFAGISQRFSMLFHQLFGGGSASLRLSEGDPLEAGVDVLVQLPGKRTQVMELLSGGEKAMTAIALVFSMFLYRPSPLCVLDEVDAPLDESNVDKYNALLRELSRNTQFLVITHNRRTMEAVERIIGVTMEEPGCSSVYHVQIDRRR